MKLLPKQKVNSLVEDQKRVQIEEGVILARKVDALREKLADLQKQHELFVSGMEDNLKERTGELFKEIKLKEAEIKLLEVKRKELLKPLDDAWLTVKEKEATLSNFEASLRVKEGQIEQKLKLIDKDKAKTTETLNHIKIRERELERTFDKAEQLRIEAEKGYIKMSTEKEKQEKLFDKRNAELNIRENAVTSYEFTLKMRNEQLDMRERELDKMKIQLIDQRQTLERAMERLKK